MRLRSFSLAVSYSHYVVCVSFPFVSQVTIKACNETYDKELFATLENIKYAGALDQASHQPARTHTHAQLIPSSHTLHHLHDLNNPPYTKPRVVTLRLWPACLRKLPREGGRSGGAPSPHACLMKPRGL